MATFHPIPTVPPCRLDIPLFLRVPCLSQLPPPPPYLGTVALHGEALRRTLFHAVLTDLSRRLRESSVAECTPLIRLQLVVVNLCEINRGREDRENENRKRRQFIGERSVRKADLPAGNLGIPDWMWCGLYKRSCKRRRQPLLSRSASEAGYGSYVSYS